MSESARLSWLTERLHLIPAQADAALLLRHAEREAILPGTFGRDVPLTARGVASAQRLGATLAALRPRISAAASPVPRCEATAKAMLRGAGLPERTVLDWRLGEHGPFTVDAEASGALFLQVGIREIVRRQLTGAQPPPGMRTTSEGVSILLSLLIDALRSGARLNLYVTHDSILAVLVASLYRLPVDEIDWPRYLDAFLLWREANQIHFAWRGLPHRSHPLGG
ncbi:MAG: histidine phosphatase family protein [Dehalococcoidia bacterium]|nr:histidine phosphatase family protein [Dehalococcoidia bacterium]